MRQLPATNSVSKSARFSISVCIFVPFYFHEVGAIKSPVLHLFPGTVMALEGALVKGCGFKKFLGASLCFSLIMISEWLSSVPCRQNFIVQPLPLLPPPGHAKASWPSPLCRQWSALHSPTKFSNISPPGE